MSVRLLVENYRVLRKIDWDLPAGVCGLVGPNGSGKTTLLDVPGVLRDILANGIWGGVAQHGDVQTLRNLRAKPDEAVKLRIQLDSLDWSVEVMTDDTRAMPTHSETIRDAGDVVLSKEHDKDLFKYGGREYNATQTAPFRLFAYEKYAPGPNKVRLLPPLSRLSEYRLYHPYNLNPIRSGSAAAAATSNVTVLLPQGENIFSLLRNWRDKRSTKGRYDFIVDGLKEAFPDIFEELELEPSGNGNTTMVTGRIFAPHSSVSLPILYAPSGLLTGLLHLAAVASTEPGGIVAIDEPENGLHPHAVKRLVQAMRDWATQEDITVLMATHSPMLLDQFKQDPEHLFVMEPGQDVLPIRLDQVRDREWLARFSLGDLYKAGDFGAPQEEEGAAA